MMLARLQRLRPVCVWKEPEFDMSLFPEHSDGDINREPLDDSHHVVYLVKRPTYTFVLTVPKTLPPTLGAALASFRIRPTDTRHTCGIALGLSELVDLYKDLHQLTEYLLQEREKRFGQL
jgi:hypothetical protein